MAPKKDMALIRAREQEAAARAAEKKKKRRQEAVEEDNRALKRLKHGVRQDQVGPSTPVVEVASPPVIVPSGIPLATPRPVMEGFPLPIPRPVTVGLGSPEPSARDRQRSSILPGDVQRFQGATSSDLVDWGYSFADSVSNLLPSVYLFSLL